MQVEKKVSLRDPRRREKEAPMIGRKLKSICHHLPILHFLWWMWQSETICSVCSGATLTAQSSMAAQGLSICWWPMPALDPRWRTCKIEEADAVTYGPCWPKGRHTERRVNHISFHNSERNEARLRQDRPRHTSDHNTSLFVVKIRRCTMKALFMIKFCSETVKLQAQKRQSAAALPVTW